MSVVVLASTSPLIAIGKLTPSIRQTESGQLVATYTILLNDYPALQPVGGSVKLTNPDQLLLNPDHVERHGFSGKDFPIAVTRVAESGSDAFKAVSTYCTHGFDFQLNDYNPILGQFICPHKGSTFLADGTHVDKSNTPPVGDLRKFPATYNEALGAITLDKVLGVEEIENIGGVPTELFLEQNYPNPFNPTTLIRYGLPARAYVELTLHTLDGRIIETLVAEDQDAGTYVMNYSADTVPSGTYFYRLRAMGRSLTRRMIVAK
ncbi:MAG: T9SS type A sorting domain-containing protein [Bacteroidetes bacterium]|nr:T9SS type A sorting domain-containing protein [Bacteroidota bacterium]